MGSLRRQQLGLEAPKPRVISFFPKWEDQKSDGVRGLYIATVQYSSFCGCALGLMLGVLDIMEVEVQDREQVEVREKVEARETEEEDKTREQQTLRHVVTCA